MRSLTPNLLRGQRGRTILAKNLRIQMVLTYGATTLTYNVGKFKRLQDTEQAFSHRAQVLLEDTDKVLHGLDLEGYKAVLSYGLITKGGEELVATAPLWVVGQDRDSYRDRLEVNFELEGIFDRMAKHKAESSLTLLSSDTQTVKDLLTGIADTTLTDGTNTPYSSYPAYTITFDSGYDDDGLIDVFTPADAFRVGLNESRWAKFRELLRYTNAVPRVGSDGEIHIFTPTTSGTVYSNEYSLAKGRDFHNYFSKRFRRRIVSPNYITFKSHPAHSPSYTGFAKDASADLTDMLERETHFVRAASNAQCTALAGALLSKLQMQSEKGSGVLPFVHFGQETYDFVNFIDARAGDSRAGNVGSMVKLYQPGQFNMSLGFGRVPFGVPSLQGLAKETGITVQALLPLIDQAYSYTEQLIDIVGDKVDINDFNQWVLDFIDDAYFRKIEVSERFRMPRGPNKFG